jgi:hypothetical protein
LHVNLVFKTSAILGETLLSIWCSLDQLLPEKVIELYHDHGTSGQFHSELKPDISIEAKYFFI